MKPKHIISFLAGLMVITACQDKKKEEAVSAVKEWMGKEILFPKNSIFTIRGTDTIDFALNASDYKIVSYIDTAGCVACQLKLAEWQRFMDEVDAASSTHTPFIFYLYPKDTKDLLIEFRREAFDYPVCLDEKDEFNRLNKLAGSKALRTFLLDKENKIVAIGNPIENPNVKKFYLKLLTGKEQETSAIQTTVELSAQELDFGTFPKEETKKLPEDKIKPLIKILENDPRPSYHTDDERIYGMEFGGYEIKFNVSGDTLKVIEVINLKSEVKR